MKRIGTPSAHSSSIRDGARVVAATGARCPETGWWFSLGNPEGQTYICRDYALPQYEGCHVDWLLAPAKAVGQMVITDNQHAARDEHHQTWCQGIWPDSLD